MDCSANSDEYLQAVHAVYCQIFSVFSNPFVLDFIHCKIIIKRCQCCCMEYQSKPTHVFFCHIFQMLNMLFRGDFLSQHGTMFYRMGHADIFNHFHIFSFVLVEVMFYHFKAMFYIFS